MEDKKKKSGLGISALTLGIISIITSLFWYMAIPTSILAIIFGAVSTKKVGSGIGKAGLITGIIGISVCAFNYISMIMILVLANNLYY